MRPSSWTQGINLRDRREVPILPWIALHDLGATPPTTERVIRDAGALWCQLRGGVGTARVGPFNNNNNPARVYFPNVLSQRLEATALPPASWKEHSV